MFHKEGTATGSQTSGAQAGTPAHSAACAGRTNRRGQGRHPNGGGGGAALDVPLRKSDRRRLRNRFAELCANESMAVVDGLLDSIFTDPSAELFARKLRTADTTAVLGGKSGEARITAYVRSSNTNKVRNGTSTSGRNGRTADVDKISSSSTGIGSATDTLTSTRFWPYSVALPVAFEVEHSDTRSTSLLPSVATLSVLPDLLVLPHIVVNTHTSKFLCRGANLMRGGMDADNVRCVVEALAATGTSSNSLSAGRIAVSVRVASNPQPFAVGLLHPDLIDGGNGGIGGGGAGVQIISCFGDDWTRIMVRELSELGDDGGLGRTGCGGSVFGGSYHDDSYGNVGFVNGGKDGRYVLGLSRVTDEDDSVEASDSEEGTRTSTRSCDDAAAADIEEAVVSLTVGDEQEQEDLRPALLQRREDGEPSSSSSKEEEEEEEEDPVQVQSDLLLECFQRAIVSLSSSLLPMPVSSFYANHVLKARPAGTTIDIKRSRWRKFSPFLAEQAALGIVIVKDNHTIASVNKGHISLKNARKQRRAEVEAAGGTIAMSTKTKTAIVSLYIIPPRIASSLALPDDLVLTEDAKAPERRGTGFLTKPEVRDCLEHYIARESLDDETGAAEIRLDATLCDLLYGRSKKERAAARDNRGDYPTRVNRKDAHEVFLKKLDCAHALVEMPGSRVVKLERGAPPKIIIDVTTLRGRRNKNVTFVRHLEEYEINPVSFANDVSKRFATSATIDEDPKHNGREALKKKNYVEIGFQGNIGEELQVLLTGGAEGRSGHGGAKGGSYKVPKNVIDLRLEKRVSARRKP